MFLKRVRFTIKESLYLYAREVLGDALPVKIYLCNMLCMRSSMSLIE